MTRRQRFRQLISAPGLTVMPGAYDALSARIIEAAGFPAVIAGGYAAIGSMLAQADGGQSNMRDFADHYARICEAVQVPVYADADTGFGGVHNVSQMVRAFEKAGVAALFFTDQVFPSRCGYLPGKQVIETAAMAERRPGEQPGEGYGDCGDSHGVVHADEVGLAGEGGDLRTLGGGELGDLAGDHERCEGRGIGDGG